MAAVSFREDTEPFAQAGLVAALHFDLQNAAERVYLTLSTDPYRYGARANVSLPE